MLWLKFTEKLHTKPIVNFDSLFGSLALDGALLAYLYIYVVAKLLHKGAKFIQKLTPGFKSHMENLENLRQAVESKKS